MEGSFDFTNQEQMNAAYKTAEILSKSQLVGDWKGKKDEIFSAMLYADALKVGIMPFLQNTYLMHGKLGMHAKLLIATVNRSKIFATPLQFTKKKDDTGIVVSCAAYANLHNGETVTGSEITWSMVQENGWNKNNKWKTIRELMFEYRAAAFFARVYCPEATMGLMTVEELEDMNAGKPEDNRKPLFGDNPPEEPKGEKGALREAMDEMTRKEAEKINAENEGNSGDGEQKASQVEAPATEPDSTGGHTEESEKSEIINSFKQNYPEMMAGEGKWLLSWLRTKKKAKEGDTLTDIPLDVYVSIQDKVKNVAAAVAKYRAAQESD
jgi:hypothetical protein